MNDDLKRYLLSSIDISLSNLDRYKELIIGEKDDFILQYLHDSYTDWMKNYLNVTELLEKD